jgi:hypothetical protein
VRKTPEDLDRLQARIDAERMFTFHASDLLR